MPLPKQTILVDIKDREDTVEVEVLNADYVRYETEARANRLNPDGSQNAMIFQTFLAWSALKRNGLYDGPWQQFKVEDCLRVADSEGEAEVDPTQPSPEFDSVSSSPAPTPEPPSTGGSAAETTS